MIVAEDPRRTLRPEAVSGLLERLVVPDGFLWGTTTAPYRIEGGFNTPDGPQNNWFDWEAQGRVERSGRALDFWADPEPLLRRAVAAGLNAFRFGVDWSRVQPRPDMTDTDVIDRYGDIASACDLLGLTPVVTLHHFTHPRWAGPLPWNEGGDAFSYQFVDFATTVARGMGRRMVSNGREPVRHWVSVNEANALAVSTHVSGSFPPGRLGDLGAAAEMLDSLTRAHVLVYDALHDLYAQEGWTPPSVTMTSTALHVYELDWMGVDIVTARQRGVTADGLLSDLASRTALVEEEMERVPRPRHPDRLLSSLVRRAARRHMAHGLPRTAAAVFASSRERKLDAVGVDFSDLFPEQRLRLPISLGRKLRVRSALSAPWEIPVNPVGLLWVLRAASHYRLPVYVAGSGLATQRQGADTLDRADGWHRDDALRVDVLAVLRALDEGIPVRGYLHRTLADDYAWGNYSTAFGLHGVLRHPDGSFEIGDLDSLGDDAAGAYRDIVESLSGADIADRLAALDCTARPSSATRHLPEPA
jgi:beta-glucosidase